MLKKTDIFKILLLAGIASFFISVFDAESTHASCYNGDGHFKVARNSLVSSFQEIGGADSAKAACDAGNGYGIIFIADKITKDGDDYTIYPVVNIATDDTSNEVKIFGMVHWSSLRGIDSTVKAVHIGYCLTWSACTGGGDYRPKVKNDDSINDTAKKSTAGDIISKSSTDKTVVRYTSSSNYPSSAYAGWSTPRYNSGDVIYVNGVNLKKEIDNIRKNKHSDLQISDSLKNGGSEGTVTIYIHRCWSNDPWGVDMDNDDTCKASSLVFYVKLGTKDSFTTFDGGVTASVGSCTSASATNPSTCMTDSATTNVTFTHKMKNTDNTAPVKQNWYIKYGTVGQNAPTVSPSSKDVNGDITLKSGDGLVSITKTGKVPHVVPITLNPGGDAKICESLGFYPKNKNGSDDTSSTFKTPAACIIVKRYSDYSFTGSVTPTVTGATKSGTKYYTDSEKVSVKFEHNICRADAADATVNNDWKTYYNLAKGSVTTSTTQSKKGTSSHTKSGSTGACKKVDTDGPRDVTVAQGDNDPVCDTLGFYKTVYHTGTMHEWAKEDACVTVHRYIWYDITGRVVASTSDTVKNTLSDDYYWVDADTAPLMFTHQLKSSSTAKKTKFKTSKPATPSTSNDFGVVTDYTESTAFAKVNTYYNQHTSPSTTKPVSVAKDTGNEYCQSMTYYSRIREDLDWNKSATFGSAKTATDCMKFKRYKTTFTGSSKVYVKEGSNKIDYTTKNEPYNATGTTYPVTVPVVFEHTVKRNNDAHGSPAARSSHIKTTLDNSGVRSGDPEGSVIDKDTVGLTAGQSTTESNTIYVKIYPDQTITLCQQMNYRNEIQGTFNGTANADKVCVTIKLGVAKCLSQEFGIHNAKNYLRASIYKNDTTTADVASEVLSTGENSIESWAKPGDQVQFKYEGCAGGEIARQYASSTTATSYDISTDLSGNLFGRTVGLKEADKNKEGNLKYTDTKTVISDASEDPGTGPFGGSYEVTVTSPSGDTDSDRLYSCESYGLDGMNNVYRIPAYIEGLTEPTYRDKCKSEDVGRLSDLGQTIKQTASWTDLWYVNDAVPAAHNGSKQAKVNLNVHVPYNYKTKVTTGGNGGYINPGSERTESIQLQIEGRDNETVDGDGPYDTTSKPTKYQLIEIIINHNYDVYDAAGFDRIVDRNEYFPDANGTISLDSRSNGLDICSDSNRKGYYSCNKVKSSTSDTKYKPGNTHTIVTHKITIPDNAVPGTKYCYIAAVWPSDSHKAIWSEESGKYIFDQDLDVADNAAGMVEGGYFWHVSGVTCYTVSKRPSIAVLGGDSYAENYISARIQKRSIDGTEAKSRLYGSWTEYGAVAGNSIKGYASGATLWGGSNIISDTPTKRDCAFSSYTFANYNCTGNLSSVNTLGSLNIDRTSSSNPENISDQIKTRYTRTDTGVVDITGLGNTIHVQNNGECTLTTKPDNSVEYAKSGENVNNFACIGDAGAKYSHYRNSGSKTVYIYSGNTGPICLDKGNDTHNAITVVHSDGTLVIGSNIVYGSYGAQYPGETAENGCYPNVYDNLNNLQQSIIIARKIVIRHDVTHIDSWLVADEIITCDPDTDWAGNVTASQINSKNCNRQLTINGPVMAKNVKLYRTYGADYEGTANHSASPAEVFNMGSETYLWAANQAQRYSQATTTYARELAPRY